LILDVPKSISRFWFLFAGWVIVAVYMVVTGCMQVWMLKKKERVFGLAGVKERVIDSELVAHYH